MDFGDSLDFDIDLDGVGDDLSAGFDIDQFVDLDGNALDDALEVPDLDADGVPDDMDDFLDVDDDGINDGIDDDIDEDEMDDEIGGLDFDGDGTADALQPIDDDGDGLSDHAFLEALAQARVSYPF